MASAINCRLSLYENMTRRYAWRMMSAELLGGLNSWQMGRPPLVRDIVPLVEVVHFHGDAPGVGLLHCGDDGERAYMVARRGMRVPVSGNELSQDIIE